MLEFAYILSITLMILLPVALAAGLRRLTPVPWLLFSLGALRLYPLPGRTPTAQRVAGRPGLAAR